MSTADNKAVHFCLSHGMLSLTQHLVLPLGKVSELSQLIKSKHSIYLQILGISGEREGITLEVYLRMEKTSMLLTTEGLYGLKNASKSSDGLSICTDITATLAQLCQQYLSRDNTCSLVLQPRYKLKEKESLRIKKISLIAGRETRLTYEN